MPFFNLGIFYLGFEKIHNYFVETAFFHFVEKKSSEYRAHLRKKIKSVQYSNNENSSTPFLMLYFWQTRAYANHQY